MKRMQESRIVETSMYGLTRGAGSHPLLLYLKHQARTFFTEDNEDNEGGTGRKLTSDPLR
jgi:hypothetical protein